MIYEIMIYGHDDFEPTGKYISAQNDAEAWYQLKWIHPNHNPAGLELREAGT